MLERVHINLSLLAGLIVTVISIILSIPFQIFAIRLAVTFCVFYVIGCMIKVYLKNNVFAVEDSYFMEEDDYPNPLPIIEETEQDSNEAESKEVLA